jgi:hypothetical protein
MATEKIQSWQCHLEDTQSKDDSQPIFTLFRACRVLFTHIIREGKKHPDISPRSLCKLEREFGHLCLWDSTCRSSAGELDDLLHKSSGLQKETLKLFVELGYILTERECMNGIRISVS